jgi:sorbitol-specific phosphotransferase system component IIBC
MLFVSELSIHDFLTEGYLIYFVQCYFFKRIDNTKKNNIEFNTHNEKKKKTNKKKKKKEKKERKKEINKKKKNNNSEIFFKFVKNNNKIHTMNYL